MNSIPNLPPGDTTPGKNALVGEMPGKHRLPGKAADSLSLSLSLSPPLGSSACLASLRRAAAKLEEGAAWTDKVLLAAGLPLGTMEPFRGDGVRGLTVAVVRVAVESIPRDGDFGSWLMPANERGWVRHIHTEFSVSPQGWEGQHLSSSSLSHPKNAPRVQAMEEKSVPASHRTTEPLNNGAGELSGAEFWGDTGCFGGHRHFSILMQVMGRGTIP